jgi:hypothetical protein
VTGDPSEGAAPYPSGLAVIAAGGAKRNWKQVITKKFLL